MRLTSALWATVLVLLATGATLAEGVIRVDPNTPAAAAAKAEPTVENDPRLGQKITYNGGYKRLHVVVDDLTQMTGVTIYSGLSSKNWQVKDIPIVVCVKDLPLGKVLRAIADAAHLRLSSRKIEDQGKVTWTYRLSRGVKEEIEIDTILERKHEAQLAVSSWAWDAMKAYGQQPEHSNTDTFTHFTSKLIASLDASAKENVFNSKVITFQGSDPRYQEIIREFYTKTWDQLGKSILKEDQVASSPTDTDLQHAALDIKLMDYGMAGGAYIDCNIGPLRWRTEGGEITSSLNLPLQKLAKGLRDIKDLNLPPCPDDVLVSSSEWDMTDPSMTLVSTEEQWDRPALNEKLDLQAPEDKRVVMADLIQALSDAAGMSIICEDFTSHREYGSQQKICELYAKDVTLSKALQGTGYTWFTDDNNRLLVGWAANNSWRENHRNLVPESYLTYLHKKLDNDGLDIDDVAGFTALTHWQFYMWIQFSRHFTTLDFSWPTDTPVWSLYSQLTPEDKALARSPQGLPLASLDRTWVESIFREEIKLNRMGGQVFSSEETSQKEREDTSAKNEAMCDPGLISTMVLKLTQHPAQFYPVASPDSKNEYTQLERVPQGASLSQYKLEIGYGQDPRQSMTFEITGIAFPAYSPERMTEILKGTKPQ